MPVQSEPESAVAGHPPLERRELGIVNIGPQTGTVIVDSEVVTLNEYVSRYVKCAMGVHFAGDGARFNLKSVPAHKAYTMRKPTLAGAYLLKRGALEALHMPTIYQPVFPGVCDSASLCRGLIVLEPGSVWDTVRPHVHERRSKSYLYFDLAVKDRVFHHIGLPNAMRHIVIQDCEAAISPPWSVHMGGTSASAFIWAIAGENLDYTDIDVLDICQLQ